MYGELKRIFLSMCRVLNFTTFKLILSVCFPPLPGEEAILEHLWKQNLAKIEGKRPSFYRLDSSVQIPNMNLRIVTYLDRSMD